MIVLAHAGHWLPQLLYLAPLLVLVVAIVVGRVRDRRERRAVPPATNEPERPAG
jgi:cytochrome c-type biogenesis protein CcmH/NrfF